MSSKQTPIHSRFGSTITARELLEGFFEFPFTWVDFWISTTSAQGLPKYLQRKEEGTVLKETEVQMPRNSFLRVEGDSQGIKILCRSGSCWITQERDLKDYLLGDKGDFTINRDGLVVVQALTDTDIVVSPEIERDSVKKQQ